MRSGRNILGVFSVCAFWAGGAQAVTGNDLMNSFIHDNDTNKSFQSGFLHGYMAGASDSMDGVFFCIPQGVNYRQISAITRKFLDQNPKRLHDQGSRLVRDALAEAFPCKK